MNIPLIERLKNNDEHRIFADMTEEEQQCLKEVGPENIEYLNDDSNMLSWLAKSDLSGFFLTSIYRIEADYEPPVEYKEEDNQMNPEIQCKNCRFWQRSVNPNTEHGGLCHRYPPEGMEGWPWSQETGWCGEFEEKEEKP